MRKKIVAGNWKMNKSLDEVVQLTYALHEQIAKLELKNNQEVIVCPSFLYLQKVKDLLLLLMNKNIKIGAQNCHQENYGAYTGEVSPAMLASMDIPYVIIGHSERRAYFEENHELLKAKTDNAMANGLTVIFCCGESLKQREAGNHFETVEQQISDSLFHLTPLQFNQIILAYEPVWAIGTGKTASPEQAEEMHAFIRSLVQQKYDRLVADNTTILYGGSCKPTNAKELFANPNVDGGLIGGASLKVADFTAIIEALD